MSNEVLIQVTLELCGTFVLILMILAMFVGGRFSRNDEPEQRRRKSLTFVLIPSAAMLIFDALSLLYDGNRTLWGSCMTRIGVFMVFLLIPALAVVMTEYIIACAGIPSGKTLVKRIRAVVIISACLYLAYLTYSFFTSSVYYFDSLNHYYRGPMYWVNSVLTAVFMVEVIAFVFILRKKLTSHEVVLFLFYILLMMSSTALQHVIPGFSFNVITVFICAIMIFIAFEIDKTMRLARQVERESEQKFELAEMKNRIAVSQLQPHFIFNVLSSIERLCRKNPPMAEQAMHNFTIFLRSDLNTMSEEHTAQFADELKFIRSYVWLEKMRFGNDFEFEEDIRAERFLLPPMTVQPLIENAVKHGMREEGVLHITLRTEQTPDHYRIIVIDDGIGFEPDVPKNDGRIHVGLSNVKSRITYLSKGSVLIDSEVGRGTTVTIELPKDAQ